MQVGKAGLLALGLTLVGLGVSAATASCEGCNYNSYHCCNQSLVWESGRSLFCKQL